MPKVPVEWKVIDFIERHRLIPRGETVVVAVSGGADSVCLLHILAKWRGQLGIKLHAAHLNHQLRGAESEADVRYVSDLAASLGVPVTIERRDVAAYRNERRCSLEEAARELRHAFLAQVGRQAGANRIAIAHTRDDHIETILMHILRGTGVAGLRGLAPCSRMAYDVQAASLFQSSPPGNRSDLLVIRPLLDVSREETSGYCAEYALAPRVDSSNLSLSFFRNRLRLELLPVLRQYNPNIDQALLRLADIAREDQVFIEQQAAELWSEVARTEDRAVYLDKKKVASLPIALQRQLLRDAVTRLAGDVRDIEAVHIEEARSLLNKPVGKMVYLPRGIVCQSGYEEVMVGSQARRSELPPCPFPQLSGEIGLEVPGETVLPGWKVVASIFSREAYKRYQENLKGVQLHGPMTANFDFGKTGACLFIRNRRPGDRFQPLGMTEPKRLHEFMIDARVPRSWRDRIPIVCSPQQIIWVVGWRIDDRVKVTEDTKEILHLEFVGTK